MTSHIDDYLDGNAAAGELGDIFSIDVTAAVGQCAHCGAIKRFADVHVYVRAPGVIARCPACGSVLLRLVRNGPRAYLDVRGMTYLSFAH
jgi:hypothetical protein